MIRRAAAVLALACAAAPAAAQTMYEQQQRLIDIHGLLLDLPPAEPPGALEPWQLSLGIEVIGIPEIDGTTGGKTQLTASDHTIAFPRPRFLLGLPPAGAVRPFVGLTYIPPVTVADVSTNYGAVEAGVAWAPGGPLSAGIRGYAAHGFSKSPVTDPNTKDTLESTLLGGDVLVGYALQLWGARWTPFAGAGVAYHDGRFRVTSDGVVLTSVVTTASIHAGLRVLAWRQWEAAFDLAAYPGYLVHPNFKLGWLWDPR
ncbi:MAG TPA: hypothetical protein VFP65_13460 [Anaeromyxobacteraceae bacterium]|nr:hypothetical protein [Anaeromyxobacteraceae bacterium]